MTDFHTAEGPALSPKPDAGLLIPSMTQQAVRDATSGAWDRESIAAHDGPLPFEVVVDRMIGRLIAENAGHARDAAALNAAHEFEARFNRDTDHARLEARSLRLQEDLTVESAKRAAQVEVLDGIRPDGEGASFTAPVPPAPVLSEAQEKGDLPAVRRALALRPTRTGRWFLDIGMTIALTAVEAVVVTGVMQQALRTDDWLRVIAYSFATVLLATAAPHAMGSALAAISHGATLTLRRAIPFFGGLLWLVSVVMLASLRTEAEERSVRNHLADLQSIAPADVDLTGQFDWWQQFFVWAVVVSGIGAVVMIVKARFHNPALTQVVRHDNVIAAQNVELTRVTAALGRIAAHRETLSVMIAHIAAQYEEHGEDVLPRLRDELIALYRNAFINAVASSPSTVILAQDAMDGASGMRIVTQSGEGLAA